MVIVYENLSWNKPVNSIKALTYYLSIKEKLKDNTLKKEVYMQGGVWFTLVNQFIALNIRQLNI